MTGKMGNPHYRAAIPGYRLGLPFTRVEIAMKTPSCAAGLAALALAFAPLPARGAPLPDPAFGDAGMAIGALPPGARAQGVASEGLVADRFNRVVFMAVNDCGVHTPVIGCAFLFVSRLKVEGVRDPLFASVGIRPLAAFETGTRPASALTIDSRDRIVAAFRNGRSTIVLVRLLEDGSGDATFGTPTIPPIDDPYVFTYLEDVYPILDVAAQSDGKVVVVTGSHEPGTAGWMRRITLFRVNPVGGLLDPTFGVGGKVYTTVRGGIGLDIGTGIGIQPDGKIVVAGRSLRLAGDYDSVVVRYLSDGTLDPAFGVGGMTVVSAGAELAYARRLTIHPDGFITVAGTVFDAAGGNGRAGLFRLRPDGAVDLTAGIVSLGGNTGAVYDLARQSDGKAVAVGFRDKLGGPGSTAAVALRYTTAGALDPTWHFDGRYEMTAPGYIDSSAVSTAIDSLGRVLVSGTQGLGMGSRWFVTRLLP